MAAAADRRGARRAAARRRALADIARINLHIASENPIAASRIVRELLLAGDSLALFPRRGRVGRKAATRELVTIAPYVVVYRIMDDRVVVLRVWHAAQDR